MPVGRGPNFKQVPLNVVGSSVFGRYPKIDIEKTYNMFISDNWLVDYPGYQVGIPASQFGNAKSGRAAYLSVKLDAIIAVFDANVYLIRLTFNQQNFKITNYTISLIGTLQSTTGYVYVAENNKPQILLSDGIALYVYDPTLTPQFQTPTIDFTPGYITFHDTYFLCAASNDTYYTPAANNTWRLSQQNDGTSWPELLDGVSFIGTLETKPDNTQAVVRFPSRGNMIFVMGKTVTESWFDVGAQLFPYQRTNYMNIDYGCVSPATVCFLDEYVVWLAFNEKTGPIIMASTGEMPEKITTDGIDYVFSHLQNPEDSQAFLYRKDGHLIYHINFYSDNQSYFYDFNTKKFFNACDQNLNYYAMGQVVYYQNQYFSVTKNDGNFYIFDTIDTTYDWQDKAGNIVTSEIPRIRTCSNIRLPSQDYFIANDIGFTIETGETNYQIQYSSVPIFLITQDGKYLITQENTAGLLVAQNSNYLLTQDGKNLATQQEEGGGDFLIANQSGQVPTYSTPCVDLSVSYDGGATFSNAFRYVLNPIGQRRNKLIWWSGGLVNDMVCQFKFWGIGRFVAWDGVVNIRE